MYENFFDYVRKRELDNRCHPQMLKQNIHHIMLKQLIREHKEPNLDKLRAINVCNSVCIIIESEEE